MYVEKYIFDVFLEICKADYVGVKSNDSETKMVCKICKNIGKLQMEYTSGNSNR